MLNKNYYFLLAFTCFIYSGVKAQASLELVSNIMYENQAMSSVWGYTSPEGIEYVLAGTSKGVSIVDISNPSEPVEVFFIPGSMGSWREIKTWKHYAYISHDNSNDNEGILIVNLQNLPEKIEVTDFKGNDSILRRAHTLFTDSAGFLYLFGGTYRLCSIYNLNNNPESPEFVGRTTGNYIHDGFVRGDTLWASDIFNGLISVWDISNKATPVLIAQFNTPSNFTHNAWLSDNSQYLFTTDETKGSFVAAFDVSNINDINLVDKFKLKPDENAIPHNVHVLNDYLILSHYTEGVVIADAKVPEKIVKIAAFDTSPDFIGEGFNGCWGVYPYFPSGLIAATDIEKGLYILKPKYAEASRIFGTVKEDSTAFILPNVNVFSEDNQLLSISDFDGKFKTGFSPSGEILLKFHLIGYDTTYLRIHLLEGDNVDTTVLLKKSDINTAINNPINKNYTFSIVNNIIQLENISSTASAEYIQLIQPNGSIALERNISGKKSIQLDIKSYPAGIYIIRLFNNKESFIYKVFKN